MHSPDSQRRGIATDREAAQCKGTARHRLVWRCNGIAERIAETQRICMAGRRLATDWLGMEALGDATEQRRTATRCNGDEKTCEAKEKQSKAKEWYRVASESKRNV